MAKELTRLCRAVHNWDFDGKAEQHTGTFTVKNGVLDVDFLTDGQYFRVINSLFGDGVWKRGSDVLTDETFSGSVWAMKVPPDVLELADSVTAFNAKVEEMGLVEKGYASESFGGYTYQLLTGAPAMMVEWQNRINAEMRRWRKI